MVLLLSLALLLGPITVFLIYCFYVEHKGIIERQKIKWGKSPFSDWPRLSMQFESMRRLQSINIENALGDRVETTQFETETRTRTTSRGEFWVPHMLNQAMDERLENALKDIQDLMDSGPFNYQEHVSDQPESWNNRDIAE